MRHYRLDSSPAPPGASAHVVADAAPHSPHGHGGHAHFWERAFSRRRFVRTATGATALVVGGGLWFPLAAAAAPKGDARPRPIPIHPISDDFGLPTLYVDYPTFGYEVSTITDFNGKVASAQIRGEGTGTDTQTGAQMRYTFDADLRFMDGVYVGLDGRTRQGTFGFI